MRFQFPALALISALSSFAPMVASRMAERALFVPPRRTPSKSGQAFLRTGTPSIIEHGSMRLAAWRWGTGPVVLCLHGWGGGASQFRSLVPALVAQRMTAIAFDGPGHGQSNGQRSSVVAIRDALLAVAAHVGTRVSIVAHSGGAAAATLALAGGLPLARAAFIGPTVDPAGWIEQAAHASGLSARVLAHVRERTERELGIAWTDLRILPHAARRDEPLLVVHDRQDDEVSWTDGADLADAWPGARLLLTQGLGHRRILHDPTVAQSIADFIAGRRFDDR